VLQWKSAIILTCCYLFLSTLQSLSHLSTLCLNPSCFCLRIVNNMSFVNHFKQTGKNPHRYMYACANILTQITHLSRLHCNAQYDSTQNIKTAQSCYTQPQCDTAYLKFLLLNIRLSLNYTVIMLFDDKPIENISSQDNL